MKGLTLKQQQILAFIEEFMETMRMAPTIYEIAAHFEIKPSTAFSHLNALVKKGALLRSGKARSIVIAERHRRRVRQIDIQTRAVAVRGGCEHKNLRFDLRFFPHDQSCGELFAQKVQDGAMPELGIFPGDLLLIQECHSASIQPGDLLLIDDSGLPAICRCVVCQSGKIETTNCTGRKVTIDPQKQEIEGVVIGLQRSY